MYEPKYKLNKRDEQRWHELLVRHCLEAPVKTAAQVRLQKQKKYRPLSPEENIEFEKLSRKRSRKIGSHPAMKAHRRRTYYRLRKVDRLMKQLTAQMRKHGLKIRVDGAK